MANPWTAYALPAALCLALFAFAFIAAPHSADWGLGAYVYSGLGVLVVLLLMPFLLQANRTILFRLCLSLGFGLFGAGTWLAGLFIANVRIITRLF